MYGTACTCTVSQKKGEIRIDFKNPFNAKGVRNLTQGTVIFLITPEICCCTTLGTQKFEFAANLKDNANKMYCLLQCSHFTVFHLIA